MAEWKKVIVSGSVAELAAVSASTGIDVDGRVSATNFYGDGSNLTNVPAGSINIEAFTDGTSITVDAGTDKLILSDNGTEKQITVSQIFDSSDFDTEVAANSAVTANTAKVSAGGNVTTHSDVSSAGSGAIITTSERNKLNAIEASADVTDATNVASAGAFMGSATTISGSFTSLSSSVAADVATNTAKVGVTTGTVTSAGALMDSELTSRSAVVAINQSLVSGATPTFTVTNFSDVSNKRFMSDAQETKLDSVESSADVTDATNVANAGALMDSEVTDLAGIKGVTISTLQVKPSEGAFANGDKTKLDGIEASADVTDATNVASAGAVMDSEVAALGLIKTLTATTISGSVTSLSSSVAADVATNTAKVGVTTGTVTSAGALMDSELTSRTNVIAINQSLVSGATPTFTTTNFTDASNKRLMTDAQETKLDSVESNSTADQTAVEIIGLLNSDLGGNFTIGNQSSDTATFSGGVTVTGDLTVSGTTTTVDTANLNVTDQFINLNDGGSAADGGIVIEGQGAAFGWDESENRWAFDFSGATESQTTITADAYASAVVTSDNSEYRKNGNIRVQSNEIYIYVE